MSRYQIIYTRSGEKELAKLPDQTIRRVRAAIHKLADQPRPPGSTKLEGMENLYRIRSGDYRVIYSVRDKDTTIVIVRICHRKDAYK